MSVEDEKLGQQLSAYLDGELGRKDARRIEQALKADPKLTGQLESLRRVREMVQSVPRQPAPAQMPQRVLARAERRVLLGKSPTAAQRPNRWWVGRLATAAIVLIAVGVGFVVLRELDQPPQVDQAAPGQPEIVGKVADTGDGSAEPGELVLAKADLQPKAPGQIAEPPVVNFFINTSMVEMPQVQAGVQRVLASNGIVEDVAEVKLARPANKIRSRLARYNQVQSRPEQVRFEVVISRPQLRQIINELNTIRTQQRVAQVPLREGDFAELMDKSSGVDEVAMAGEAAPRKGGVIRALPAPGAGRGGKPEVDKDLEGVGRVRETESGQYAGALRESLPASKPAAHGQLESEPMATAEPPPPGARLAVDGPVTTPTGRASDAAMGVAATAPAIKSIADQRQLAGFAVADVVELQIVLNSVIAAPAASRIASQPAERE